MQTEKENLNVKKRDFSCYKLLYSIFFALKKLLYACNVFISKHKVGWGLDFDR